MGLEGGAAVLHSDSVLELEGVCFGYGREGRANPVIDIGRFRIRSGESVFLRGPSGAGKSTLLGLVGGVLAPWSGRVEVCGHDMAGLQPARRDRVRADHLGIIFQQLNLLPYLDVVANVTLACRFSRARARASAARDGTVEAQARRLLSELGLPESALSRPVAELSVGQQQRVAVARALVGAPDLVVADEPTSALDTANRDRFIELLDAQRRQTGCALLFVSHDKGLARHFGRAVDLAEINRAGARADAIREPA